MTGRDGRTWTTHIGPSPTLKLYILAALQTGARRSELLNLRWTDVDLAVRTITFRETKNGDARTVPMTDVLFDALRGLPQPETADMRVLPPRHPMVLTRAFSRLVRRLGLKNLRFHDLRHDAANTLTMNGSQQATIMAILGHRTRV